MDEPRGGVAGWHDAPMPDLPETLYARTLRALRDTTACPACAAVLRGGRCPACGLDVSGPEGAHVWADSQRVADVLAARQERVEALRAGQRVASGPPVRPAAPAVPTGTPVPASSTPPVAAVPAAPSAPSPVPGGPVPRGPVTGGPVGPTPPTGGGPAARPARGAWRVQTVLQVVGASLLAAASVTFLVFAWDVMGLRGRAAVVAVGTLVVFALASWLRARRLTQGAEAVGAVAVVLLLLDAWALRATEVLVLGSGAAQAAASALVCAALVTAWGVRSRLRVGRVTGAALVVLAPLAWLPDARDAAPAAGLLLVAAAATTLRGVVPWADGRAERVLLRAAGAAVLPLAVLVLLVDALGGTGSPWPRVALLAAATGVAVLQVVVEARAGRGARSATGAEGRGGARTARTAWAAAAGVLPGLTVAVLVGTLVRPAVGPLVAPQLAVVGVCAAGAVLLLVRGRWRGPAGDAPGPGADPAAAASPPPPGRADADLATATAAALVTAAVAAAWSALVAVAATTALLQPGPPTDSLRTTAAATATALVAAGALGVLTARRTRGTSARLGGRAARAAAVIVALQLPLLAAAGPLEPLVALGGEALVVVVAALLARRGRADGRAARVAAVGGAALAVLAAAPDPAWTAVALLVPAGLALVARTWSASSAAAAASTVVATVLSLLAAAVAGPAVDLPGATTAALALAVVVPALLVRSHRTGPGAGGPAERDAALATAAATTAVLWVAAAAAPAPGAVAPAAVAALPAAAAIVAAVAALAQVAHVLVRARRPTTPHVPLAAGAAAPVAALAVATVHVTTGAPPVAGVALLTVALGVVAVATAPLLRGADDRDARPAAEVTGGVVVGAGLVVAATTGPGPLAVALVLAAVGAAVWAQAPGRAHAWWATLALGSAAWWVVLGARDVGPLEAYVVPPGLVLAAVGARRLVRGRGPDGTLLVTGLAAATLPTALLPARLAVGGLVLDRGLVTAVVAAALTAAALGVARRHARAGELLAALAAALWLAGPASRAVTAALGRTTGDLPPLLADGTALVELAAWPAAAGLAVAAAAVRTSAVRRVLDVAVPWTVALVATLPSLLVVLVHVDTPSAAIRSAALAVAGAAVALAGAATGRRVTAAGPSDAPVPGAGVVLARLGLLPAVGATATGTVVLLERDLDGPLGPGTDLAVLGLALVLLACAALAARRGDARPPWAWAGVTALVPVLLVREGATRPLLWWGVVVALLLLAITLRGRPAARPTVRVLTTAAVGVALLGPWAAAAAHAASAPTPAPLGVEVPALLTWLVVLAHVRAAGRPAGHLEAGALVAVLALPTALAVDASLLGTVRGVAVLLGGSVLAWWAADRRGVVRGLTTAALATTALALRGGPEPVDVPWTVLGLVAVTVGVRHLLRGGTTSWTPLGAPLVLTLGAPLAGLVLDPAGWRVVALLALGLAAVVTGALRRWQAPFLLGAAAVVATLVVVLSPVAATALAAVDGWVLLGIGGAVVLGLGLTYERRVRQAREAVRFVADMR